MELELHRLTPLVYFSLEAHGFIDAIPHPYFIGKIKETYRETLRKNTIFLETLDRILQTMGERNLHPVIWKGMVLADSFYPDPGTRLMNDIDFAIPPDEMDEATAVFESLGLQRREWYSIPKGYITPDAMHFSNQIGVRCDVHYRVRLFEGKESMNLTNDLKPQRMSVPVLTVLEPNAMLVHLIVHLDGHRSKSGYMLLRILDLAFMFRKWGALLEYERIKKLMPAQKHFSSLFRITRFLEHEFEEKPPEWLANAAKSCEPFTLAEILRERRLAQWDLPSLRGWLRLAATRLALRPRYGCSYPHASDLFLWPIDVIKNRRMGTSIKETYKY